MPSLVYTSRWNVTRRYFPHALLEQISTFVSATLLHAWQTQQNHRWHASPTGLSRKTNPTNGVANKSRSLEGYDRWLSITLQCRSALTKSTQQGHRPPFSRREVAAWGSCFLIFRQTDTTPRKAGQSNHISIATTKKVPFAFGDQLLTGRDGTLAVQCWP